MTDGKSAIRRRNDGMLSLRRCALAAFVVAILALSGASAASAATYCVSDSACVAGGGTSEPDVQTALDAAQATSAPDTVRIGAGTFAGTAHNAHGNVDAFSYTASPSTNTVSIVGAGAGSTTLTGDTATGETILDVDGGANTITGLQIEIPAAGGDTGLSMTNSTATGVPVVDHTPGTSNDTGVTMFESTYAGADASHKANVTLTGAGSLGIDEENGSTVTDATIVANGTALKTGGTVLAQRFSATAGTAANLSDGTATLEDAVLTQSAGLSGGFVVFAVAQNLDMHVVARHLTIVGSASASGLTLANEGDGNGASVKATATLRNSIIRGTNTPLQAEGTFDPSSSDTNTATIDVDYSDFNGSGDSTTGASGKATIATGGHDLNVDPQFAGSSDYHLRSGSPVVDTADPASTGGSTTDLDGNLRSINGSGAAPCPNSGASQPCPDMGAYEFKPAGNNAPVCGNLGGSVRHNTPTPLTLTCTDPDSGDTLTYAVVTQPSHGGLTNVAPNGTMTYTPSRGYAGQDTFTFRAVDNHGAPSNTATVTLDVAANAPPTCSDQQVGVPYGTQTVVTLGCSDPDGDGLLWQIKSQPQHGSIVGYPDGGGHVSYLPDSTYSGPDSFTFVAEDPEGAVSQTRTVSITVGPAPAAAQSFGDSGLRASIDSLTPTSAVFRAVYSLPQDPHANQCFFHAVRLDAAGDVGVEELFSLEPPGSAALCQVHGPDSQGTRVVDVGGGRLEFLYVLKGLKPGTYYQVSWSAGFKSAGVNFQTPVYPGLATPTPTKPIPPPKQDPGSGGGSNVGITQPIYNGTPGTSGSSGVIIPSGPGTGSGGSGGGPATGGPSTGGPSNGPGQTVPGNPGNDPNAPNAYTGDGCYDRYGRPIKPFGDPCYEPPKHRATHRRGARIHLFAFTRRPHLFVGVSYLRVRLGPAALRTLARRAHHGRVRVVVYAILIHAHRVSAINLHWMTLRLPRRHRQHR